MASSSGDGACRRRTSACPDCQRSVTARFAGLASRSSPVRTEGGSGVRRGLLALGTPPVPVAALLANPRVGQRLSADDTSILVPDYDAPCGGY